MRAVRLALIAAALAAVPAAVLAQTPEAQERMRRAQEDLRQYQLQQRQPDLQARQDDLEARLRTQQNLDSLAAPTLPNYTTTYQSAVSAVPNVIDLSAQSAMVQAELAAQNERLRQLGR